MRKDWMRFILGIFLLLMTLGVAAHTPPDHAKVYFVGIKDGDRVKSPFPIKFGIEGFGVIHAGAAGKGRHTAGHFHLLVDVAELPDMDEPIPRGEGFIHYDRGETETLLELSPGEHTLQLLLGDEEHEPHMPVLISEPITVVVE